jgi:septum formation protein
MTDRIILASGSPRRKELLSSCGIKFKPVEHTFDESSVKISDPVKLAMKLAQGKARSIAEKRSYSDEFVLGVDTIVAVKNKVLGKPDSSEEAESFINLLSGKTHRVISGISLIHTGRSIEITRYSVSYVKFRPIDPDFIKFYLDNDHWKGYAGGYAIQSIFGLVAEKIKGSYSNIVGLPVDVLYSMLKEVNYSIF